MAYCLWLCHRMTDRLDFSNPDQALSSGGSHLVMLAPQSEVLPGQVSSSLFGGLKAMGGSVRDLHLHLHAAGPATVAAVVSPEAPVSLYSSISVPKLFPKASCQRCILPKLWEEQCGKGSVCWIWGHFGCSGSWLVMQPVLCTDSSEMFKEECVLTVFKRSLPWCVNTVFKLLDIHDCIKERFSKGLHILSMPDTCTVDGCWCLPFYFSLAV